ncbi:hypothetical protein L9F63_001691, partial [Diploptera punctata]
KRGLAIARMQKQRRELWRHSTLAQKNHPTKLHLSSIIGLRDVSDALGSIECPNARII